MDKRTLVYLFLLAISFYIIQLFFPSKASIQPNSQNVQSQTSQSVAANKDQNNEAPTVYLNSDDKEENYYVLENEYEQLVFSDIGGALVEINLPLKSKENPDSMVRSIGFDKKILKESEINSFFPLKNYFTPDMKKQKAKQGGFYPLLRRSILNSNGSFKIKEDPSYYALNIIKENDKNFAKQKYKVKRFENGLIEFVLDSKTASVTKTYTFAKTKNEQKNLPYLIDLKISIKSKDHNFYLSSGVLDVEMVSNAFTPYLKYRALFDGKEKVKKFALPKTEKSSDKLPIDWVSNENGFFGLILNPLKPSPIFKAEQVDGKDLPTRLTLIDAEYDTYPARKYPGYQIFLKLPTKLSSNDEINLRFFSGPYQDSLLKTIDKEFMKTTGFNSSYISVKKPFGFFTFISEPFARLLLVIMRLFYFLTHSWGFSIILLTIAFRVMLYPLNAWSIKSTSRMNEISPMVKIIQAKHKKDPKKAQMEIIQMYKEKKVNPASGCLPVLIQMPFLIGMFDLLKSTFELRGVPFISGWINNLTAPDVLFSWDYPIYFIGTELHLLPILLGIVMLIQAKMNVKVPKGGVLTEQQKQTKNMSWIMTIFLTVLFYNAASGLNIYFFFSMLLGVLQQWWMNKKKQKIQA